MINRVYQHLRLLGYDQRSSARFTNRIDRWITLSGMEWTCNRLKELKIVFRAKLETGVYSAPDGWATRHTRDGRTIFKDHFVHTVMSLPTDVPGNLRRIEGFLRLATLLKLKGVSIKQREKLETAIEADPKTDLNAMLKHCKEKHLLKVRQLHFRSDVVNIRSEGDKSCDLSQLLDQKNKRSPTYKVDYKGRITIMATTVRSKAEAGDWLEYFQSDRQTSAYWESHPGFVAERLLGVKHYPFSYYAERTCSNPIGTLSALQEGSCKVRWIANPILAFQALGEPLKRKLQAFTNLCYTEVRVIDQDDGRKTVSEWLKNGLVVWSLDCTSFTDRFPVTLQLEVLNSLEEQGIVDRCDTDLFRLVINKSWSSTDLGRLVKWKVGQPLGFGPSFPIATLTHAVLLDNLDVKRSGLWRVVGDDVVIADETLASNYKEFMRMADVEINLTKSLESDTYAEFLGKLITSLGVVPSMKVKLLVGPERVVDNMMFYGQSALDHFSIGELIEGVGVFAPEALGGADWRLSDIPYAEWIKLLRVDSMAHSLRSKVLREAIPRERLYSRDAVEDKLNRRTTFFDRNTLPLSQSEWETGYTVDVKINGFTNIPVGFPGVDDPNPSLYRPASWVQLVDQEMVYKNHFKAAIVWFVEQTYGYAINQSEKPFTGQSVSYRNITSDENIKRKSKNFFSRQGIEKFLEREEGTQISNRSREILKAFGEVQSTKGETHGQVRLTDERTHLREGFSVKRRKSRRPSRHCQFAKSD